MLKNIPYTTINTAAGPYAATDGTLAIATNLIYERGALRPLCAPGIIDHVPTGQHIVFIHRGSDYTNYIVASTSTIGWMHHDTFITLQPQETITDIAAIGNVLVVSSSLHLYYVLFKDKAYHLLGTELPRVNIRFALNAQLVQQDYDENLTFSDFSSADKTYQADQSATFDAEMYSNSSSAYIPSTIAKEVPIALPKALEQNVEYKVEASGTGFSKLYLYAATAANANFDRLAEVRGGRSATFRAAKAYKVFRANILADNGSPSYHCAGTVKISKGFDNTVAGKVIEYTADNYQAVMGATNKFVNEKATEQSRFIYPFFVRYALRLYDGSYARISEPVLMIPNSGYAPLIEFTEGSNKLSLYAFIAQLQCDIQNAIDDRWRDIVSGVDIFVSPPAYPYNQGDNFKESEKRFEFAVINATEGVDQIKGTSFGYCCLSGVSQTANYGYAKHDLAATAKRQFGFGDTATKNDWRVIRIAKADDQMEKIQNTASFFLVHSFEFDEFNAAVNKDELDDYHTIDIKKGVLSALVNRHSLDDNSLSNATFFNAHLHTYNQRLHLFDYAMRLPAPDTPAQMNPIVYRHDTRGTLCQLTVFIKTAQGERIVKTTEMFEDEQPTALPWFFYPHTGAYKAVLVFKTVEGVYNVATLNLKTHPFLNGAYWLAESLDDDMPTDATSTTIEETTVNDTCLYPNAVLLSEVDNPFAFLPSRMVTVGVNRIISMAAAVQALSQGQFGQFPLYAFTSEGVWALEVNSEGAYSAKQPITRDVCTNAKAITQIDNAVLFVAQRGIMCIAGATTECISTEIDNDDRPFAKSLPVMQGIINQTNLNHLDTPRLDMENIDCIPFRDFIDSCRMLYDYPRQRIIVYNPAYQYQYVYSLEEKSWGMMAYTVVDHLNAYPNALALDADDNLVDFSACLPAAKTLLVTMPFKLDLPDTHKTVDAVYQRGFFTRNAISQVLYASNDLHHWHYVWSSGNERLTGFRGTPYKFFCLAVTAHLNDYEQLFGFSASFTPRLTNRLR